VIRAAVAADRDAIARLHFDSWRNAYRGMLPDAYIDGALAADLAADWVHKFEDLGDHRLILLAEGKAGVDGFVAMKLADGWAEIDNLHVAWDRRRRGIGRALLGVSVPLLEARGIGRAFLYVFTANAPALGFYDRLGGRRVGRETQELFGHSVELFRYEWLGLDALRRPNIA